MFPPLPVALHNFKDGGTPTRKKIWFLIFSPQTKDIVILILPVFTKFLVVFQEPIKSKPLRLFGAELN